MKPETVSTQWVKVDYKDKIKRNRTLGGDLNRHPSVDDHLPIENVLYSQATHTHTLTCNLAIFTATKTTPQGPTSSNFHLPR